MFTFVDAYKLAFEETCKQNQIYYLLDNEILFDGKNTFKFLDENTRNIRNRVGFHNLGTLWA